MTDINLTPDKPLPSTTIKMVFSCGSVYLVLDESEGKLVRVDLKKGHTGMCPQALLEAVSGLVTDRLSSGGSMEGVIRVLRGIRCEGGYVGNLSCMDVLARQLEMRYGVGKEE